MRRAIVVAGLIIAAVGAIVFIAKPGLLIQIASGSVSQNICSKTFVSGLPPDEIFAQDLQPEPGMGLIDWALHYEVEPSRREVSTTVFGAFKSRSVYREGFGCVLQYDTGARAGPARLQDSAMSVAQEPQPALPMPDVVVPTDGALKSAIDRAFEQPQGGPPGWTHAIVVVHDGQVIAERYAPGYGVDTPLLSHSIAKSVINALIGILVRQGKLTVSGLVPIAAWQQEGDSRRAVTPDQLLRMSSGLGLDEGIGPGPSQQMWFTEPDTAAFAEQAPLAAAPGTTWAYSNRGYAILSRIVRDAIGGDPHDIAAFAQRELFAPLGMQHATIEFDSAGTPAGSNAMFATAREWARFGQLYLNDGVVGDRRILPDGWVAYTTRQTLDAGYGAGFWLNTLDTPIAAWGTHWGIPGAPRDAFMARGYLGQYVIVVPSENLVIVRFGASHIRAGDIEGAGALVHDVIAALQ